MKRHEFLDDEARDLLAQHVLGTLPEAEARTWSLHVAECAVCRREEEELSVVVRTLGTLGPRREPGPSVWRRIEERIRAPDPETGPLTGPGTVGAPSPFSLVLGERATAGAQHRSGTVRRVDDDWLTTGVPGVEIRMLHVDVRSDRATILARMAPGSSYPAHVHAGPEECFVIRGELWEGGKRLSAGDYERAPGGSRHEVQTTPEGCLLLIVSSLGDRAV